MADPVAAGRRHAVGVVDMALSALAGFASFLAWLGYGYLDVWHAVGTLLLLPVFAVGLWLGRPPAPLCGRGGIADASWLIVALRESRGSPWWLIGPTLVTLGSAGMIVGGLVILVIGGTTVFVPRI